MSDLSANNNRIAKNTLFLYVRMFFALIINLYTSRVLLNALGVEDYGVYNVVAGFVSLFSFLNATLSSCIQRFYNYEETLNGVDGFKKVYTSALLIHTIIAFLILILLESFGLWYVNKIMIVPTNRLLGANILFQMSTLSLVFITIQIPFVGAVLAKENMNLYAIISILEVTLKLFVALIVSWSSYDHLILLGILLSVVSLLVLLSYIVYCHCKYPEMRLQNSIDKSILRSMLSFSGWNLIGTFAFMLKGQGLNILLNYYFGPVINAARGIAYQVNGAISGFTSSIATAFAPQIVHSYAEGERQRTINMMFTESKICFSLIAIIIVPVILEIEYLLYLWLGDIVPNETNVFSILVLFDTLICSLNTPCTQVIQATGKIKYFQIGSTTVNLSLLPIAWIFLRMGYPARVVFICTIVISSINQFVCLYFTNKQIKFGLASYFRQIVLRCLIFILFVPIIPIILHSVIPNALLRLLIVGCSSVVVGILCVYLIILSKEERIFLKNKVLRKFICVK